MFRVVLPCLLLACTDSGSTTAVTGTSSTGDTDTSYIQEATLTLTPDELPVTVVDVVLTLDPAATAAVLCTARGDPRDVHRLEALSPARDHTWRLHGLLASETYDCVVQVAGESVGSPAAVTTGTLPADLTTGAVTSPSSLSQTGVYTLYNHKGFCDADYTHRLVLVDPEGRVRWYWEGLDSDFGVGVVGDHLGNGEFLSAGGTSENAGPRVSNLDGEVLYETPESWGIVFHHYAEQLSNGHMLSLGEQENENSAGDTWKGTQLIEHDPETNTIVREWRSQQAVDAGEHEVFDVGLTGVDLNTNWASRDEAGHWYLSLCGAQRLAKLDPDSGDVIWVIGPDLGWTLQDESGAALEDDDWPQCQHGVEVVDVDRLLVYDNGRDRLSSRGAEFVIDPATLTVTRTWLWTEPDWYEQAWGDIDSLTEDRVLIAIGHCTCCRETSENVTRILEVDRPTGEVVWRFELPADDSVLYQASRMSGCELFNNIAYCPDLAE